MSSYPVPDFLLYAATALAFFAFPPPCYSFNAHDSITGNRFNYARYAYCQPGKGARDDIVLWLTDTTFSCDQNSCAQNYDSCTLAIDYTLSSESQAGAPVETAVACRAKIIYRTAHGYLLSSESESADISPAIRAHEQYQATMTIGFQFSTYEAVVEASLHSVECFIRKAAPFFQNVSLSGN